MIFDLNFLILRTTQSMPDKIQKFFFNILCFLCETWNVNFSEDPHQQSQSSISYVYIQLLLAIVCVLTKTGSVSFWNAFRMGMTIL